MLTEITNRSGEPLYASAADAQGGRNHPESVDELPWNRWTICSGISGRFELECVVDLRRNTQPEGRAHFSTTSRDSISGAEARSGIGSLHSSDDGLGNQARAKGASSAEEAVVRREWGMVSPWEQPPNLKKTHLSHRSLSRALARGWFDRRLS